MLLRCVGFSNHESASVAQGMLPYKMLALNSNTVPLQGGAAPLNSQVRAEDFHKRYVKMRDALAK